MLGWEVIPRVGFGNFTVSPHGLGIAVGYFAGTMLLARRARERGFNEDHAWNAAALAVVGAILGARIAYIIGHFSEFQGPLEWLQIYKGGISLVGGMLGGFLAGYIYTRRMNIDFLQLTDLGAPGIALGVAIGRIGDLIIGDHLGKTTDGWWGWTYKGGELISQPRCTYTTIDGCIVPGMTVHQTALYDMIWSLIIFGILMWLEKKPRPKGFITLTWASLYAVGRILTDFARVDKDWFGLGLTGSQLTSIAVLGVCVYFLFARRGLAPVPATVPAGGGAAAAQPSSGMPRPGKGRTQEAAGSEGTAQPAGEAATATMTKPRKKEPEEELDPNVSVFKKSRERLGLPADREPAPSVDRETAPPPAAAPAAAPKPKPKSNAEPEPEPVPEPEPELPDEDLDEFDWEP